MKPLPEFPIGVQYYRQPTPLPEEWDGDLRAIKAMGFDLIQLRPQWRWHERNEGEFDFSDLDRLFDLAEQHGLQVLLKFFLGTAPEWVFDRYGGMRLRPTGEPLFPMTHGSVYVGGYTPCFDQDVVRRKALPFVRAITRRYKDRPSLVAWNAWNEPRSNPAADCACPDSLRKYRAWLQRRFGTIEVLNRFAGLAWPGRGADFSAVKPPTAYFDYLGWFLFRTWRAEMIADRMRWMYAEIRKIDRDHPIMAHAGFCSPLQDALEDTSNDYLNARELDLYGSSCPNRPDDLHALDHLPPAHHAAVVDLTCSRLRGVSQPFWINEIYGNRAMYLGPTRPAFPRHTTWHAVAGGAKGLIYWQYRSERLTTETNDAGLVEMNGAPTDRSREVSRAAKILSAHRAEFASAAPPKAVVGILYDFASDLLSRIETAAPGPVRVDQGNREDYPYKTSLRGIHLAFWELDLPADLVPSEEFARLLEYPVAYLPCPRLVSAEQAAIMARYVEQGGLLVSEPSPGMREPNAWAALQVPPAPLDALFGGREALRIRTETPRTLTTRQGRLVCPPGLFLSTLEPAGAGTSVLGRWEDGTAAIVARRHGRGRAVLLGAPLGEVYFHTRDRALRRFLTAALRAHGLRPESLLRRRGDDVRVRRLVKSDGAEVLFVFNARRRAADVAIARRGKTAIREWTDLGLGFRRTAGAFIACVPAEEVLIVELT